jgi:hypothetical protein
MSKRIPFILRNQIIRSLRRGLSTTEVRARIQFFDIGDQPNFGFYALYARSLCFNFQRVLFAAFPKRR